MGKDMPWRWVEIMTDRPGPELFDAVASIRPASRPGSGWDWRRHASNCSDTPDRVDLIRDICCVEALLNAAMRKRFGG